MDLDEEVRAAVKRMARPRPAPDHLASRLPEETRTVQRRRRVLVSVVGAALAVLAAVLVPRFIGATDHASSTAGATGDGWVVRPSTGMTINPYVGSYGGVVVGIDADFDQTRVLTSGQISGANQLGIVNFRPNDGTDVDAGYPVPLTIPHGTTVSAEANLLPDCGTTPSIAPRFVITSRDSQGTQYKNTAPVSSPKAWQVAVNKWCAKGLQIHPSMGSTKPNGDQVTVLTIINPGPDPVTVVSKDTRHQGRGWTPARVKVPAAATREFTIHGTNTQNLPRAPLSANGKPVDLN